MKLSESTIRKWVREALLEDVIVENIELDDVIRNILDDDIIFELLSTKVGRRRGEGPGGRGSSRRSASGSDSETGESVSGVDSSRAGRTQGSNKIESMSSEAQPKFRKFAELANAAGITLRFVSTHRFPSHQWNLKHGPNRVTGNPVAQPCRSDHQYGYAADINATYTDSNGRKVRAHMKSSEASWRPVVELSKQAGLQWLGMRDPVHFYLRNVSSSIKDKCDSFYTSKLGTSSRSSWGSARMKSLENDPEIRNILRVTESELKDILLLVKNDKRITELLTTSAGSGRGSGSISSRVEDSFEEEEEVVSLSGDAAENAEIEVAKWQGKNEKDSNMASTLASYAEWLGLDSEYFPGAPWSGGFVSYAMRNDSSFPKAAGHMRYMGAAKAARDAGKTSGFVAFQPDEVTPERGDIVCRPREGSGNGWDKIGRKNHCDIYLGGDRVAGGNLNDTAEERAYNKDITSMVIKRLAETLSTGAGAGASSGGSSSSDESGSVDDAGGAGATSSGEMVDSGNVKIIGMNIKEGEPAKVLYYYGGVPAGTKGRDFVAGKIQGIGSRTPIIAVIGNFTESFSSMKSKLEDFIKDKNISVSESMLGGWSRGAQGLADAMKSGGFSKVIYADPSPGYLTGTKHGNAKIYYNPENWTGKYAHLGQQQIPLATAMGQKDSGLKSGQSHEVILLSSLRELLS